MAAQDVVHVAPGGMGTGARTAARGWRAWHVGVLLGLWAVVFAAAMSTPPLLDDADSTHAQAAQAMLRTGDWVTLHVDGIRYLEKPPLPYWMVAVCLKMFGNDAFAVHLPLALTVLGLALLGYGWGRRAFGERAGLYAGVFLLTSAGVFLFTRVFIPDALLSLLLAFALYAMLRVLDVGEGRPRLWAHGLWVTLALAVLTKGFVALVFFFGAAVVFLIASGQGRRWRGDFPFTGIVLAFAIAAPWHILAGLRNKGGADGHGFFWFYFINEHVLRFWAEAAAGTTTSCRRRCTGRCIWCGCFRGACLCRLHCCRLGARGMRGWRWRMLARTANGCRACSWRGGTGARGGEF